MSRLLGFPLALPRLALPQLALPRRLKAPWSRRAKLVAAILALAAALAVVFVIFRAEESGNVSQRARSKATAAPAMVLRAARARAVALAHTARTKPQHEERSLVRVADSSHAEALFAIHSWYVAPPPPPPPPAPAAATAASLAPSGPTVPPLPFQYIGSFKPDGGAQVFFLMEGDRVYDVRVGDALEDTYSIDAFNGSQLSLTYKPLNIKQQLSAGGTP